ncbi:MAG: hypothetical protein RJQ14_21615 [Marinoscillum sp.]
MKTFFYLISSMLFSFVWTGQIADPIPERIEPSNLTFKLKEFVQITPSSDEIPVARINILREAPDDSGLLFVIDLREQLWMLMDGQPGLYLDVSAEFDGFIDEPGLGSGFGCFAFQSGI